MAQIKANGIRIEYESHGNPAHPALILISGFSRQLIDWPQDLVDRLVAADLRVIRFDNRDVGLSERFDQFGVPDFGALFTALQAGAMPAVAYTMEDMARDVIGLMDALEIKKAHVAGASMGGMITQITVVQHPDRVLKAVPIMTTSGAPGLPSATPEAQQMLLARPDNDSREAVVELAVKSRHIIGSAPGIRDTDERLTELAGAAFDRSYDPAGVARQFAAIQATPRWHDLLSTVATPMLLLHGRIDPLLPLGCGEDAARRVPGSKLVVIEDWGHDLPQAMVPRIAQEMTTFLTA